MGQCGIYSNCGQINFYILSVASSQTTGNVHVEPGDDDDDDGEMSGGQS